jgi:hypothetical protein
MATCVHTAVFRQQATLTFGSTRAHLVRIPGLLHGPKELDSLLVVVLHVPPYLQRVCHHVLGIICERFKGQNVAISDKLWLCISPPLAPTWNAD